MRLDIHHYFEGKLHIMNTDLSTQLSSLVSTLFEKDSTIASQSAVIAGGDSSVSTAVSAAVDAEDTTVASEISSALSAG